MVIVTVFIVVSMRVITVYKAFFCASSHEHCKEAVPQRGEQKSIEGRSKCFSINITARKTNFQTVNPEPHVIAGRPHTCALQPHCWRAMSGKCRALKVPSR